MIRKDAKTTFIVHSNGQDEWLRIDKRTYQNFIDKIYDAHESELKAKDEAYAKLQQAYDNLTAQYQKDVNELKAKLEPKTCDGCEYEGDKVGGFCYAFHTTCSREPTFDHFTPYKFFRKGE